MTIIWYCLSQLYETNWVWDTENRSKLHYSGAFLTGRTSSQGGVFYLIFVFIESIGIYGMLNIYVFAVLVLFSPVHSHVDDMDELSKCKRDIQRDS